MNNFSGDSYICMDFAYLCIIIRIVVYKPNITDNRKCGLSFKFGFIGALGESYSGVKGAKPPSPKSNGRQCRGRQPQRECIPKSEVFGCGLQMPLKQHLSVVRQERKRLGARGSARKFLFAIKPFSIFLRPQPRVGGRSPLRHRPPARFYLKGLRPLHPPFF